MTYNPKNEFSEIFYLVIAAQFINNPLFFILTYQHNFTSAISKTRHFKHKSIFLYLWRLCILVNVKVLQSYFKTQEILPFLMD